MNWPLTDTLCVETAILVQSSCDNVWQPTNLSTLHLWLRRTSRWTTVDIVIQCPLVVATITEADFCFFCLWIITACQYRGRYIPATRHFAVTLSTSRYVFSIPRQLSYYYVYSFAGGIIVWRYAQPYAGYCVQHRCSRLPGQTRQPVKCDMKPILHQLILRYFNVYQIKSIKIKSNLFATKKNIMQQKKQSKYVDRTQRQYETALTSALQNKNTTTKI